MAKREDWNGRGDGEERIGETRNATGSYAGSSAGAAVPIVVNAGTGDGAQACVSASVGALTFADACDAWEAAMRGAGRVRESTLRTDVSSLNNMRRVIGERLLTDVSLADVEEAMGAIRRERKLSGASMLNVHIVARRVFAFAVERGWLECSPMEKMTAPRKNVVVGRRSLSIGECARLTDELDRAELETFAAVLADARGDVRVRGSGGGGFVPALVTASCIVTARLCLASGMRRSEVLGLTWSAVDLERGEIHVRQSVAALADRDVPGCPQMVVSPTKTHAGTRSLCVDAGCVAHLRRWKRVQAEWLMHAYELGDDEVVPQHAETPVCVSEEGGWLSAQRVIYWWGTPRHEGFRDKAGLPGVRMHELRHTQATLLLGAGVDIKTVQTRLGHATSKVTLDMYAHALPANDREAAELMGSITAGWRGIGGEVTEEQAKAARSRLRVVG